MVLIITVADLDVVDVIIWSLSYLGYLRSYCLIIILVKNYEDFKI